MLKCQFLYKYSYYYYYYYGVTEPLVSSSYLKLFGINISFHTQFYKDVPLQHLSGPLAL